MTLEMLISTLNCQDELMLIKKMNISSDAILINQREEVYYKSINYKKNKIKIYGFNERGIGLSRNNALFRASGNICVFSDDDMIYTDDYKEKIEKAYNMYPDADMIVFNVNIQSGGQVRRTVKSYGRVSLFSCLRYGTVTFTVKRWSILKNNLSFSLLFGGSKYASGEDSLFIWNVLKKKMKVYKVPLTIANVYNDNSSWFEGYNDKYFYDKGALFRALSPSFYKFMIIQFIIRKNKKFKNYKILKLYKLMNKGSQDYRCL